MNEVSFELSYEKEIEFLDITQCLKIFVLFLYDIHINIFSKERESAWFEMNIFILYIIG